MQRFLLFQKTKNRKCPNIFFVLFMFATQINTVICLASISCTVTIQMPATESRKNVFKERRGGRKSPKIRSAKSPKWTSIDVSTKRQSPSRFFFLNAENYASI